MQQFNIDISQPRGPLVIYASQADSHSRFFEVTVTDNGAAYTPPEGAIYTVRFGKAGMPAGWYDTITEVGGSTHPAVVVDGNTYTVEIAEQALGTPGENALVLIVSDATGYTLASWAFMLQVAGVPGYDAPEATVYYNALTEQVAQTLANAQAAAESAAEAATSAAEAAASAASIDPETLVKEVNGETPVAGAVSVTTRNLAYQVGDTITTTDESFDPNTAIGGTWTQNVTYTKDVPFTQITLPEGVTVQNPSVTGYLVRNGICFLYMDGVYTSKVGPIALDIPRAAIQVAQYTIDRQSLFIPMSYGYIQANGPINGHAVTLSYPVLDNDVTKAYVWSKTA